MERGDLTKIVRIELGDHETSGVMHFLEPCREANYFQFPFSHKTQKKEEREMRRVNLRRVSGGKATNDTAL